MSDRIKDFQSQMKNIHGSDQILAAIAYVPLFGWLIPYYGKKDDELCHFHGKQAMQLNAVMLAVYFLVWLLENFFVFSLLFGEGRMLHPLSRSVWLLTALAYVGVSLIGAFKAFAEEKWEIPFLDEYVNKAIDYVKGQGR